MPKVLLCDDDRSLCRGLARLLKAAHIDVTVTDGHGAIRRLSDNHFDAVVTDLIMPGSDGFEVLAAAQQASPDLPVVVMSGSAEISDAVRAMRLGARDFRIKPFAFEALEDTLSGLLTESVTPTLPDPIKWRNTHAPWLLGDAPVMLPVLSLLSQVADTACTVLITGESGTGKELVARSIVAGSNPPATTSFPVNCAAIPDELVESELLVTPKAHLQGQSQTGLVVLHRRTVEPSSLTK